MFAMRYQNLLMALLLVGSRVESGPVSTSSELNVLKIMFEQTNTYFVLLITVHLYQNCN